MAAAAVSRRPHLACLPPALCIAGILKYTNVDELVADVLPSGTPATPPATQVLRTLL